MTPIEETICRLKEDLEKFGQEWLKDPNSDEAKRNTLAVLEAINVIEEDVYGKRITSIAYIFG